MVQTVKFSQFADANLTNTTNMLVGVSAPSGGVNFQTPVTVSWVSAGRPSPPYLGLMGYNATLNVPEYWNGIAWIQLSGGGGSVTEVDTGTGLVGGPITTAGVISYAPIAALSLWANTSNTVAVPSVTPLSTFLLAANNLVELTNDADARENLFLSASPGLPGQVLTSNGTVVAPTWQQSQGSGTVEYGLTNEVAWYNDDGNAVVGLPTIANGALVTNSSGAPYIWPLSNFLLAANNLAELTNNATARANLFLAAGLGTIGQVLTSNGVSAPPTWQPVTGSGTVNPGLVNQLAWYASSSTIVSGLTTAANGVLVTNASGVPSISVGGQIPGTNTNNGANTGNIGELISSTVLGAAAVICANATPLNLTSILLGAGDWNVWGNLFFTGGSIANTRGWINTVSGTQPDNSQLYWNQPNPAATASGFVVPFQPFSFAAPTVVYLGGYINGTGVLRLCGSIYARRAR